MKKVDLVVTRHPGLVSYLKEIGIADESTKVIPHVSSPGMLKGKHVVGVLPVSLAKLCDPFTEIPLAISPEMRGEELSLEQVREIAGKPVSYRIEEI